MRKLGDRQQDVGDEEGSFGNFEKHAIGIAS